MPPKKDYYKTLGVPRTATEELIKRRYRELVRQHHPDVAEDKEAATTMFLQIQEAYQTLINADRRLIYDASLDTPRFASRNTGPSAPSQPRPQGASAGGPPHGAQANHAHTRPHTGRTTQAYQAQANRVAEAVQCIRRAEAEFAKGQFRSAIWACKEAQRLDPRNVAAHVILGDVYRIQGQVDDAITMYTIAVQLDPRNADVQAKLDRLIRQSAAAAPAAADDAMAADRRSSLTVGMNLVGWTIAMASLFWLHWNSGPPIPWFAEHTPFIGTWSGALIGVMMVLGIVMGFVMSMTSAVRRLDDELVFQGVKTAGRKAAVLPIGLIMVLLNFFSFYVAAAMYFIIGVIQDSLSKSVLKALATVFLLTVGIAIAHGTGTTQVLVFGGNVIFPAMLVGWGIGDICRPDW